MKIKEGKYNNELSVNTEGWVSFGTFLCEVFNYLSKHKVSSHVYEFTPGKYIELDADEESETYARTIELGTFVLYNEGFVCDKLAHIGIMINKKEGKREFTILGVDFGEAGEIRSIGVDSRGAR